MRASKEMANATNVLCVSLSLFIRDVRGQCLGDCPCTLHVYSGCTFRSLLFMCMRAAASPFEDYSHHSERQRCVLFVGCLIKIKTLS